MSTHHFAKPEYALKRADEFIGLGYKTKALEALYSVVTSRRHKTWSKVIEKVMLKFLELCVELRRGHLAKDGLHQYRNITQQYPQSLEVVLKFFLDKAREHASYAQQKAVEMALVVGDLEDEDTTAAYGQMQAKERTERILDREVVTPWLKFLWETYRTVLDSLRNNTKLETLYKQTTEQAFDFCLKHKRTNEFRRLSELLRQHLTNMSKYHQTQLDQESTIQFQLEIRLAQLSTAADLELWQEAFRSVEDINNILHIFKKTPQPEMMVSYYEKLAKIFWVSENYIFHAMSLLKFLELTREIKKDQMDPEVQRNLCSQVLLAALSIPFAAEDEQQNTEYNLEFDLQRDKNAKMAQLLGFTEVEPRRDAVLAAILSSDVVKHVFPEVEAAFSLMEEKFAPLQLSPALKKAYEMMAEKPNLTQYKDTVARWGSVRLMQHLSDVFSTVKLERLQKLLPGPSRTLHQVEKLIVQSLQQKLIECRLDHKTNTIQFQTASFESASVRYRLTEAAVQLQKVQQQIRPAKLQEAQAAKRALFVQVAEQLDEEHRRLMQRRQDIERIKQNREKREEEERKRQEEEEKRKQREAEEAEKQRQLAKIAEREAKRQAEKEAEAKAAELKAVMEKISEIAPKAVGAAAVSSAALPDLVQPGKIVDAATLVEEHVRKIVSEKDKMEKKLKDLSEKMDHLVRAKRENEIPLLKDQIQKRSQDDRTYWETQVKVYLENHKKQWEAHQEEKKRVAKMQADKKVFQEKILAERRVVFEKLQAERAEKIAKLKAERDAKRKVEEERRAAEEARKAAEDAERRAREEEARKQRQEEARKRIEEEDRRAAEAEARGEVLDDEEEEEEDMPREREQPRRDEKPAGSWRREAREAAPAARPTGPSEGWKNRMAAAGPREERRFGGSGDGEEERGAGGWRRGPRGGDDERPPREEREEPAGSWRRQPREGGAMPPREDRPREDRPPREEGGWRRGGDRDERPPREEGVRPGGWRDRAPREDRPPREDGGRFGGPRGDRDERPPREEGGRFGGPRGDRDAPRGDRDAPRGDRDAPREDREEGGNWRRGDRPPRDGDRPREDRPPREDGGRFGGPRGGDRDERPPRDEGARGGGWRDRAPRDGDRPREDRPPREEGGWRRGGDRAPAGDRPPRGGDRPPRDAPAENAGGDDGWTKVKGRK